MDHTTAIIEDRSRVTSNINVMDSPVLDSHVLYNSETRPDSSLCAALTPPVIEALQEVMELSSLESAPEFLTPSLSVDLRHELESPVRDIHHAFARFLLIDVASGDATADTVKAYHREVKYFCQWCQQCGVEPQHARRSHIEGYRVEGYREDLKARGIGVATRSHKISIVRRFFDAAVKHGLLKNNPAANVRGGKDLTPPVEKIKALTHNALAALAAGIPGDTITGARDRAIIALMAVHGLRRVEVQRLDHEHILIEDDKPRLLVQGKGNQMRTVFLREDTHRLLANYTSAKLDAGLSFTGAVFVSHANRARGQRLIRRSFNHIVDRHLSASSLKRMGVSCHALRHTHGTLAVANGAKIEHVQKNMGHKKMDTTMLYVEAVSREKNNPAKFIDVEF